MKRTKIVATIGPASEKKAILEKMFASGLNVARLNFSHGTYPNHAMLIKNIRSVAKKLRVNVALMQDLQGPRIRIGEIDKDGIKVDKGEEVVLVTADYKIPAKSTVKYVPISYATLYREVKPNEPILIEDAVIELSVIRINQKAIRCQVVVGGVIKSHKGMNFPDSAILCPATTSKDLQDLDFGIKHGVDFVAMSFVRNAADVTKLRKRIFALEKKYGQEVKDFRNWHNDSDVGLHTRIIAKIERQEAVKNFDEILKAADGIMVARGDLGIEMPFENLPLIQKAIIDKCRQAGKPVIVATQMLDSMIRNPRPTRAEVSDVANAILDGTDAIMLSGETATGQYPLEAVAAMNRIALEIEAREVTEQRNKDNKFKNETSLTQIIGFVAQDLAEDVSGAKMIVCATVSGFIARSISRFRSGVPIVAVSPVQKTVNQLSLSWGVEAYLIPKTPAFNDFLNKAKKLFIAHHLVKRGDLVVLVAGRPFNKKIQANLVTIETI